MTSTLCVMFLFTFCGVFLPTMVTARPSRHFKELILHERIVPFDDSMDGDDYYVDPGNDEGESLLSVGVPATSLPQSLSSKPAAENASQSSLKETVTESQPTINHAAEETKSTKAPDDFDDDVDSDDDDEDEDEEEEKLDTDVDKDDNDVDKDNNQDNKNIGRSTDDGDEEKDNVVTLKNNIDNNNPESSDPCRYVYCRMGRVCRPNPEGQGICMCASADHCHGNSRRVCGTDGQYYPSHCELHRSACVKGIHISTDHSGKKCTEGSSFNHSTPSFVSKPESRVSEGNFDNFGKETLESITEMPSSSVSRCTAKKLAQLMSNLIDFHCLRLGKNFNCSDKHNRHIVVGNILSYYDRNGNRFLDSTELNFAELRDHLKELSVDCHLVDMLRLNKDIDMDGQLSLSEFFAAFDVSAATLEDSLKVYTTSVTIGNSVELKCDVKEVDKITWKRKGHSLEGVVDKQMRIFDDGSLYIGDLRLDHMGNYTCQDRLSNDVIQTHVLLVQTLPSVQVHPLAQIHLSGSTVTLKCRADGVPRPEVTWEKNEWPLQAADDNQQRYLFLHNNTILEIKSADYKYDTGAYKCKARNSAGISDQVAAVFVENVATSKHSSYLKQSELFAIFHDNGYTVYEVGHCHTEHQVTKEFRGFKSPIGLKDNVDTLCPVNETCSWSDAVVVKNKFIYVAQPTLRRVVVIEMDRSNPTEVVLMEKFPVKLNYIEQLDEVWVTCLKDEGSTLSQGQKSVFIIRQASADTTHFTTQLLPPDSGFLEITDLYLPPSNTLKHNFDYGYVARGKEMAVHKLHLASMTYAKDISLSEHSCMPKSISYIPIGGQILVGCAAQESEVKPSFYLVLDYITDGMLDRLEVNGDSYTSPDGRGVVIIGDRGNTVFVFRANDDGNLEHVFDEYTQLHLDDVAFFPSESGLNYDAFIASAGPASILHLDLETGRVSITEGLGQPLSSFRWPKSEHSRIIVSGGPFAEHLMTSSEKSAVVIDGRRRRIQCEWQEVVHGNVIIPLPESRRE